MLASQAIAEIREEIHDVEALEYSDKILLRYINQAIQYVNGVLAQMGHSEMIEEALFQNNDPIPKNFLRWCGQYPARLCGGKIVIYDRDYASVGMTMRYYKGKDNISAAERLPFQSDAACGLVVQAACIFALNRNEFDVAQDSQLAQQLQQALAGAAGGAV